MSGRSVNITTLFLGRLRSPKQLTYRICTKARLESRMVVKGQLVEPTICFSDLYACEELIDSLIRHQPNNIMLRQQTFFLYNVFFNYRYSCK